MVAGAILAVGGSESLPTADLAAVSGHAARFRIWSDFRERRGDNVPRAFWRPSQQRPIEARLFVLIISPAARPSRGDGRGHLGLR